MNYKIDFCEMNFTYFEFTQNMSKPALSKPTITANAYKTSDESKLAIVLKSFLQEVQQTTKCIMLVVDVSGSMKIPMKDFQDTSSQSDVLIQDLNVTPSAYAPPTPSRLGPSATIPYQPPFVSQDLDETPSAYDLPPMPASLRPSPTIPYQPSFVSRDLDETPSVYDLPPMPASLRPSPTIPYQPSFVSQDLDETPSAYPPMPPSLRPSLTIPYRGHSDEIDKKTRLRAVAGFINRILDMLAFIKDQQNVKQEIIISLFSDDCRSFSTIEGLTYEQIRQGVKSELRRNGGTNFEKALNEIKKYKELYAKQTDGEGKIVSVFVSDGVDGSGKEKKFIQEKYKGEADLAIGVGSGDEDFDEETLRAISKKFFATNDAKEMRDEVAMFSMDITTMLGRNLTIKPVGDESHIFYSNMKMSKDKDRNDECSVSVMSKLMEFYIIVLKGATLNMSYTLQNGEQMIEILHFNEENENISGDTSYGNQIKFTIETLERLDKLPTEISGMSNPQTKLTFIKGIKDDVETSPYFTTYVDTRVGVYLRHLLNQLGRMSLTKDERTLLKLAQNVGSDAFRNTSSDSACAYYSPSVSGGLTPSSSGTPSALRACSSSTTYGSMCLLCQDETAHREVIYNPCGHFRTCAKCTLTWNKTNNTCPYCRQQYTGIILVELSKEQKDDSWNMKCTTCKKRQIEIVSENCKHVFSCEPCLKKQMIAKSLDPTTLICCTVCSEEVTKYKKIFM